MRNKREQVRSAHESNSRRRLLLPRKRGPRGQRWQARPRRVCSACTSWLPQTHTSRASCPKPHKPLSLTLAAQCAIFQQQAHQQAQQCLRPTARQAHGDGGAAVVVGDNTSRFVSLVVLLRVRACPCVSSQSSPWPLRLQGLLSYRCVHQGASLSFRQTLLCGVVWTKAKRRKGAREVTFLAVSGQVWFF
jgi:hypothetical protein